MASRPAEQLLARISELYEDALAAAEADDLELALSTIHEVEPLIARVPRLPEPNPAERAQHQRAVRAHRALVDRLADERGQARELLGRNRQGRRVLAAYGRRSVESGLRLERDG